NDPAETGDVRNITPDHQAQEKRGRNPFPYGKKELRPLNSLWREKFVWQFGSPFPYFPECHLALT
ncbi:MAG: hypothetical protein VCE74_09305, partial [Alphaproteobacteria bacterium]